jgi:cell division protein FtsW
MLRAGQVIQLTVIALLGVGLVMVHSAGMTVGDGAKPLSSVLMSRNMIYAGIAILAMLFASRINVRQIFTSRGLTNPLIWMVVAALSMAALTLVPGMGKSVNGASRWLYLGPKGWGLSFQPSELVKWVMVVVIAWWCARRWGVMHRFSYGLLPPLMLIGVACGLIIIEDLGTATLIGGVALCLLFAGGARWWQLGLIAPGPVAAVAYFIFSSPYRMDRILAFLHPFDHPTTIGYHPIQSMLAIAQGGLFGRGLGNGIQKFGYLPEDTTDFIFAIICEEMGIAGAALVVGLYVVLLWVGMGIVRDCRDTFARLLGLGVLLTVGIQALINIAVVTVVVPTKGIALPLISSGGTGWIVTAFAIGLVAALDNANRMTAEEGEELAPQPVTTLALGKQIEPTSAAA